MIDIPFQLEPKHKIRYYRCITRPPPPLSHLEVNHSWLYTKPPLYAYTTRCCCWRGGKRGMFSYLKEDKRGSPGVIIIFLKKEEKQPPSSSCYQEKPQQNKSAFNFECLWEKWGDSKKRRGWRARARTGPAAFLWLCARCGRNRKVSARAPHVTAFPCVFLCVVVVARRSNTQPPSCHWQGGHFLSEMVEKKEK